MTTHNPVPDYIAEGHVGKRCHFEDCPAGAKFAASVPGKELILCGRHLPTYTEVLLDTYHEPVTIRRIPSLNRSHVAKVTV